MSKPQYIARLVQKENGSFDVITKTNQIYSFTINEEFAAREFFQSVARQEMGYASGYIPKSV
jgi:hypothetical protein